MDDDTDFINAIAEIWFVNDLYTLSDLEKRLFTPYELDQVDNEHAINDYDPDVHFFSDLNVAHGSSEYYCDRKFNTLISSSDAGLKNALSFFNINIRSIPKNIDKLSSYLDLLNFDFTFVGVTETWFSESTIGVNSLNGYNHEAFYRTNRRGGGVSLFIKQDVNFTKRSDLNIFDPDMTESVFVEIDKTAFNLDKNVVVGVIYRMPDKDVNIFNERLNHLFDLIKREKKICYLLGDFNINLLHYETHVPSGDFVDICFSNGFVPLINKPTRITKHSATLIDNFITNNIVNVSFVHGLFLTDISDHLPIFLIDKRVSVESKTIVQRKRQHTHSRMTQFRDILHSHSFEDTLSIQDTHTACNSFLTDISSMYDTCFPLTVKSFKYTNKKPWLTVGLRQSIRFKNILYKKYLKNPTDLNRTNYKKYRNKLHHILRCAERQHYEEVIKNNKNNLRKTWGVMKEIINKKKTTSKASFFVHNDAKITDSQSISNLFNTFFVNVGKSLSDKIPPTNRSAMSYIKSTYSKSFYMKPTNRNELIIAIKNLKPNSSSGWDEVSPKVIQFCHVQLVDPLVHLINLSFEQGVFPDALKIAKVIPLFKNGDMTRFTNYRPISVLSVFSKLFERLFYNRLIDFLNQENILYDKQFGFRKAHSTQLALILLLDKITTALDEGNYVIGVFLDFSKAFDTVNHSILLEKLSHYGIRGHANNWVHSYLDNRKQFVSFNDVSSNMQDVNCGVPQGSILGPLLFLIYINDLSSVSDKLFTYMFADDTNVFSAGDNLRDLEVLINNELSLVCEWLKSNKLSLNVDKTHFMVFSPTKMKSSYDVQLSIENKAIEKVTHTKFLGVILDEKLNWKPHVQYVKTKLSKSIGIMNKARQLLNKESLLSLYYAFIYPYIMYCVIIWGGSNKTTLDPIIKVQKRAVRFISGKPRQTPSEPLFNEHSILRFQQIYKLQVLLFVFKFKHSLLPLVFNNFYINNNDIHGYRTRQAYDFHPPRFRNDRRKNSVKYMGCIYWNKLDNSIKSESMSLKMFKRHLLKHCY